MPRPSLLGLAACAALAAAEDPIVTGTAPWQYQLDRTRLVMPASAPFSNVKNAHGVQIDAEDGSIYMIYEPKEIYDGLQCLVKFDKEGRQGTGLGPLELCKYTPHGLRYEYDAAAKQGYLYHAHNGQHVFKTTTDGKIVWELDVTSWQTERPQYWPFLPTEVAVVPGTDVMWVTDGYGSSFVHKFNKTNAEYLGASFGGGKTASIDPLEFNCPHRMMVDAAVPDRMIVMDRANSRFVWVTHEGHYVDHASVAAPVDGLQMPCSYKIANNSVSVVPSLGSLGPMADGAVGIYNHTALAATHMAGAAAAPMSVLEIAKLLGGEGHVHPHDSIMLSNGDIINVCWAPGAMSYWRLLN
eukprot:TRINITY_DN4604_c0_g3_i1.p1 TRINITY_DN4604_c0_g3~~TRINITY_DN4604_c0_g3_i1.p1  ORF type:complete len:354 (+),score=146.20 TRINITY_DN4604_c0_g3_i1:56-1117(+)